MSIYFIFREIMVQVFEVNKMLNTMQNHGVMQIKLNVLAICLLRSTASFIEDHLVIFVGKRSNWTKKLVWCEVRIQT